MSELSTAIRALNDDAAQRILATVARHRLQPAAGTVTAITPELTQALAGAVGATPAAAPVTPGELARATLLLLAEEPARQPELQALIDHPPAEQFALDPITIGALGTVALVALQTYVKIEYDKEKGLRIKIERQPLDKSLLAQVIGLLNRLTGGS